VSLAGIDDLDLLRSGDNILKSKPWRMIARPEQLAPLGDWETWLICSGRGFGKTRTGIEWIHEVAKEYPWARIGMAAPTTDDSKKVLVFGPSGILATAEPGFRPEWHAADRFLSYPNGALVFIYSAEEPDRTRGPQHSHFYGDEVAAWPKLAEMLDNIRMGLRVGKHPRLMLTTTPRPLTEIRAMFKDPKTVVVQRSTWDNEANLPAAFIAQMHRRYDDTRLGKQELEGQILDDASALFTQAMLDRTRVASLPQIMAWGVGVDPSAGSKDGNDDQGIGVGGLGTDGHLFITGDATVKLPPAGWGNAAVVAAISCNPWATIWVERNMGGDLAAHVIRVASRDAGIDGLQIEEVVAKSGKHVRAEPLSALFEQGRAHILGQYEGIPVPDKPGHYDVVPEGSRIIQSDWSKDLEEELLGFTALGYTGSKSPNRADGCVWMALGLMPTFTGSVVVPRSLVRGLILDEADAAV
jgi:phage terminase large subunit-like protein